MEFSNEHRVYLQGQKFSSGLAIPIARRVSFIEDRLSLLEDEASGKKVIHLGCVDHLELIQEKMKYDRWLHPRLVKRAKRCIGIDINREGVDFLKNNLGFTDIYYGDISHEDIPVIQEEYWDLLILGEILEHINDPVSFLSSIHLRYRDHIAKILITVPNAFSLRNIQNLFRKQELINSDHRYWFTPYTLAKILVTAGFEIDKFRFCEGSYPTPKNPLKKIRRFFSPKRFLYRHYPACMDTLVMWAEF